MIVRMIVLAMLVAVALPAAAQQTRDQKVRADRQQLEQSDIWIYNDLDRALAKAREEGKPLFVVVRCIPCEACSQFDKQLLAEGNEVHDLLDDFVCVRIVQANGLDLSLFQFDYDQSFHALFLTPDKTILGRYGTRSARPEHEDMTMAGLRQAMLGALVLHREYPANRSQLAGKQGHPVDVPVPEQLPALRDRYGATLDYGPQLVQSCIHCHQIRDSQRLTLRQSDQPIPSKLLFPYPLPDAIGLRMDPDDKATVQAVAEDSAASRAGFEPGDRIQSLEGQPLLSIADMQWVLHHAPQQGELRAEVQRGDSTLELAIPLEAGWRDRSDISFRPTTWDLRRMVTGGMVLEALPDAERREMELADGRMALRVKYMGQYGQHAAGRNAGFQVGDIIVQAADRSDLLTEGQFIQFALGRKRGTTLPVRIVRGEETRDLQLPMQ